MKKCSRCKKTKPLASFSKWGRSPDGHQYRCKSCASEVAKEYESPNRAAAKVATAARKAARPKAIGWQKKNPGKHCARVNKDSAKKMHRLPPWADLKAIEAFYVNCPPGYHVDHILPKEGYWVSGLHVLSNLQYLTPEENIAKGNRRQ